MKDNDLEISVGVTVEAGFFFHVDKDEWNALTAEQRAALIEKKLDGASDTLANQNHYIGDGWFTGQIIEPAEQVNLEEVTVYEYSSHSEYNGTDTIGD